MNTRRVVGPIAVLGLGAFFTVCLLVATLLSPSRGTFVSPLPVVAAPATPAIAVPTEGLPVSPADSPPKPNWTDVWGFWLNAGGVAISLLGLLLVAGGGFLAYRQLTTAVAQLRLVETSTAMEALSQLANRWDSDRLIRARKFINDHEAKELADLIAREDDANTDLFYDVQSLVGFFEELGYLCRTPTVRADDTVVNYISEVFLHPVLRYYPRLEGYIERKSESGESQFAAYFVALYERLNSA